MGTTAPPAGSRRERAREATTAEIKETARNLLVGSGPEAVTLRAIARDMGMSAPALYRYFASHEELLAAVREDVLAEITHALEAARDAAGDEPVDRLLGACRAFRRWSLEHPREFQLVFASAGEPPPLERPPEECVGDLAFGAVFLGIFVEIWQRRPFLAPSESDLPAPLVSQLRVFSAAVGDVLPLGALAAWLAGWVRLFGAVTLEVFGHLGFALTDPEPMFEAMLADMRRLLSQPPLPG